MEGSMSSDSPKKSRWGIGVNVVTATAIVAAILGVVNAVAFRHPVRWDFTRAQLYTLSDKTLKVLQSLPSPVQITVFYQPTHSLYKRVADLLKEFAEKGKEKLKIEFLDPDRDVARTRQAAAQLKVDALNTVVVSCGQKLKQVSDADLVEYDFSNMQMGEAPKIKNFKGEEAVVNALLTVTEEKQPKIYFLTGHGEKEIDSFGQEGIVAVGRFLEQNNMKGEKLLLLGKTEIPKDCDLLVIAGATKPITDAESKLISQYLAAGGALWMLIDPLTQTGLEPLLTQWGVDVGNDMVVDPSTGIAFISAANLFINHYSGHPITQNMSSVATLFVMARSVSAATGEKASKEWRATPLLSTTPAGWGETNVMAQTYELNEKEDRKGPVSIGVAVEPEEGTGAKGRAVVVGDSEFITNTQLQNVGNSDFVYNILQWLLQREKLISVAPKTPEQIELHLNSQQMSRLFWVSVMGLPFLGLGAGSLVWLRRRS